MAIVPIKKEPIIAEVRVVGIDVWWDHDKKIWRKKRLRLDKIPLQYRCPICGKSVGKHPRTTTLGDMKKRAKEIEEWNEYVKENPNSPWKGTYPKDPADQVYRVPSIIVTDPRVGLMLAKMRLMVKDGFGFFNTFGGWGGVCRDCREDGFGYDRNNLTLRLSKEISALKPTFHGKPSIGEIFRQSKKITEKIADFELFLPNIQKKLNNEKIEMKRVVISIKGNIDFMWMTDKEVESIRALKKATKELSK